VFLSRLFLSKSQEELAQSKGRRAGSGNLDCIPHSCGMRLPKVDTVVIYRTIYWSSQYRDDIQTSVWSASSSLSRPDRLMSLSSRDGLISILSELKKLLAAISSSSSAKVGIGCSSFRRSQIVQTHQPTRMATAAQSEPTRIRVTVLESWKHMKQNATRNEIILSDKINISYNKFKVYRRWT